MNEHSNPIWVARERSSMQVVDGRPKGLFARWQGASDILKN